MDNKNGWWNTEEDLMDNGKEFSDGPWAKGWNERCGNNIFKKDKKYLVRLEDIGVIECVWDGDDFYANENVNCKRPCGTYISGICIGVKLGNKYRIFAVGEV